MGDNEDYWEYFREQEELEDAAEAEERKEEVGMAEEGTDEYCRNAEYVLSAYRHPSEETQSKLDWLRSR